jgi:hypothetical protein
MHRMRQVHDFGRRVVFGRTHLNVEDHTKL